MTTWNFTTNWNAFQPGPSALVFSASEFKEQWMWGIPICSSTGETLSDNTINQRILAAQKFVEQYLGVKLFKQIMIENQDFNIEQFINWSFILTNWKVNSPISLTGNYNQQQILVYPAEWLSVQRTNDQVAFNNLYIVPNGKNNVALDFLYVSFSALVINGLKNVPNFWIITYDTGFDPIPEDIIRLIGLMVSVDILMLTEQGIAGRSMFGLASSSVSLDGLSQSASKINGGNIFQNRIKTTQDEANQLQAQLRSMYGGIRLNVC